MRPISPAWQPLRRTVAAVAVVTVAVVGLTATVGSAQSGGAADPNGILKFATDLQVAGDGQGSGPDQVASVGDFLQMNLVYDTLLHAEDDGTYKPGLA